jgi:hypothetical protein
MATAATTNRPAPSASLLVDDLERELKFVLPATRVDIAARLLGMLCKPDSQYPDADVWTIYYDSQGFESLDEKLNSDYLKTKIRVRWYSPPGGTGEGPVFLEAKQRVGNRRDKVRVLLPMAADTLASRRLSDPVFSALPDRLAAKGFLLGPDWHPMLALRYRRRRFVDVSTGARVSLDSEITAVGVNHRYLFARDLGPLPVAVVEVKGRAETLPGHLRPLITLGLRKQSMSKYAALLLQLRRALH